MVGFSNCSYDLFVVLRNFDIEILVLCPWSVSIGSWIVEASVSLFGLAVGNVDISSRFSIGNLAKSSNDEGISGIHVTFFSLEVGYELVSFVVDGQLIVEARVVGVEQLKVVLFLQQL